MISATNRLGGNVEKKADKIMTKIFLSFEAENEDELLRLVLGYALRGKKLPSWVGAPLDAEAHQAEAEAREAFEKFDDEDDAKPSSFPDGNGEDPEPAPTAPEPPAKRARAVRAPRVSMTPPVSPAPAAALPAAPPVEYPPLDTLKAVVTNHVRLAQKGEGSKKILDLLPAFKDATGLTFVMNAEDKHRAALYDLCVAAGLPVV
jgi:hypothetical protein